MTEPTELHITSMTSPQHNGFNISCFGGDDGEINLSVTGGAPPYTYQWSNGQFTDHPTNLTKGIYWVIVRDANNHAVAQQIALTEPPQLKIESLNPLIYANGFHISCFNCSNGELSATLSGGVGNKMYHWSNGQTSTTISGLNAGNYDLWVQDGNGCQTGKSYIELLQPERDDWAMSGNYSVSNLQYLGTNDSTALIMKVNNQERFKITPDNKLIFKGEINLGTSSTDTIRPVYLDQQGILRIGDPNIPTTPCNIPNYAFYKKRCVGGLTPVIPDQNFYFIGSSIPDSKIVIGTPQNPLPSTVGNYKMYVAGGILTEKLRVANPGSTFWADFVFNDNYNLKPLNEVASFINTQKHLPEIPSEDEVNKNGIDVLELQAKLLQKIEELYLYIIEQNKRIVTLEQVKVEK